DASDPRAAAAGAHAGRGGGPAGASADPSGASERAAAASTALGGESLRETAPVSGSPDADAARPHEVPGPDRGDRALASVPAPGARARAPWGEAPVRGGDAVGHCACEPSGARGARAKPRRAAAADAAFARPHRAAGCQRDEAD